MNRRAFLKLGAFCLADVLLVPNAFAETRIVALVPLIIERNGQRWDPPAIDTFPDELRAIYTIDVDVAEPMYLETKEDCNASKMLEMMRRMPYECSLGVMGAPLYMSREKQDRIGVSGYAESPGRRAITSSYWRKTDVLATGRKIAVPAETKHQRMLDVMIHEFGHNLGAGHCNDYGCTMYDDPKAKHKRLDAPIGVFCKAHREQLHGWLR